MNRAQLTAKTGTPLWEIGQMHDARSRPAASTRSYRQFTLRDWPLTARRFPPPWSVLS
jgi:hypothetical protein